MPYVMPAVYSYIYCCTLEYANRANVMGIPGRANARGINTYSSRSICIYEIACRHSSLPATLYQFIDGVMCHVILRIPESVTSVCIILVMQYNKCELRSVRQSVHLLHTVEGQNKTAVPLGRSYSSICIYHIQQYSQQYSKTVYSSSSTACTSKYVIGMHRHKIFLTPPIQQAAVCEG